MSSLSNWSKMLVRGVAAGILGTAVMTLVFLILQRATAHRPTIAPSYPERLVGRTASRTGVQDVAAEPEIRGEVAAIAHFSYGAFWGALYAVARLLLPIPAMLAGTALGLIAWAIGFVGWLPAMRHLPAPWHRPASHVLAGLISHVAYGLGTAGAYHLLVSPADDTIDTGRGTPIARLIGEPLAAGQHWTD